MKKLLILFTLTAIIAPSITFASWWNPFTWKIFKTSEIYIQTKIPTTTSTIKNVTANKNVSTPNSTPTKAETLSKKEVTKTTPLKTVTLTKLSNAEIIKKVKPAVVYIETDNGSGSGMIISSDGYILTNAHVVTDISNARVTISTGGILNALVIGRDEKIDLAVLKVEGYDLPVVVFGDSAIVEQGDDVFTLGYPFGLKGDVSFKEGTISRRINDGSGTYLETSAEIHPGNSGGPLVNTRGQVIGVNSASLGSSVKGVAIGETIKFAIPINTAKELIPDLKLGRQVVIPKTEIPATGNPFQAEDSSLKIAKCQAEKQASYNSAMQMLDQKLQQELNTVKEQIIQRRNARINEINAVAKQNDESCKSIPMIPAGIIACFQNNSDQAMQLMTSTSRASDEDWAQAKRNSETAKQTFTSQITPTLDQQYLTCLNS